MKSINLTCFILLIVFSLCRGETAVKTDAQLSDSDARKTSLLDLFLRYLEMDLEDETKREFQDSVLQRNARVELLMVGLKGAGKTAIFNSLGIDIHTTTPIKGFTIKTGEDSKYISQAFSITSWDVGGQDRIRTIWRPYFLNKQGLIFVIDSSDRVMIGEANDELNRFLSEDELRNVPLLVFANNQEVPGAMNTAQVTEELGLQHIRNRQWYIQALVATDGDGLFEGFDWILQHISKM